MEYHSMKELFAVADAEKCSPGIIACRVEAEESGKSYEEIWARMKYTIPIFRESIQKGLSDTSKSASGLVGGDANRLFTGHMRFISPLCQRAASYAIATAEANAKMYRIVACPTAPAALFPLSFLRWRKKPMLPCMTSLAPSLQLAPLAG